MQTLTGTTLTKTPSNRADTVRHDVNDLLRTYLQEQIDRAAAVDASYAGLWQATSDLVMAGGKRLRPYLAILGYEAFGGEDYPSMLRAALSQEFLHTSLLIHDDIIDRDYLRYAHDNVAGAFRKKYASVTSDADEATHYAHSAALLAGDVILAAAHQAILQGNFSEVRRRRALQLFETSVFEVAGGEFLDAESALAPLEAVDSFKIARYKTSSYSFAGPLGVGAALAGADDQAIRELQQFGQDIGIAYQFVDDLLGLFGQPEVTGKPAISDVREGKRTYVMQQAMRLASPADQAIIARSLGNPKVSQADLEAIRSIVVACGAKANTEKLIGRYQEQALERLNIITIATPARIALEDLVHAALVRSK